MFINRFVLIKCKQISGWKLFEILKLYLYA